MHTVQTVSKVPYYPQYKTPLLCTDLLICLLINLSILSTLSKMPILYFCILLNKHFVLFVHDHRKRHIFKALNGTFPLENKSFS